MNFSLDLEKVPTTDAQVAGTFAAMSDTINPTNLFGTDTFATTGRFNAQAATQSQAQDPIVVNSNAAFQPIQAASQYRHWDGTVHEEVVEDIAEQLARDAKLTTKFFLNILFKLKLTFCLTLLYIV